MKPHPFDYVRCDTVDEATELLAQHGDAARILAGGQSLLAMLNLRLLEPAVVIDISRIAELAEIRESGGKVVSVGGRLLDGAAAIIIRQFFERLGRQLKPESAPAETSAWGRLIRFLRSLVGGGQ